MKKGLRYAIISVLAVLISVMVSCDNGGTGGGIDNTPAVVNATKAFQIYGTNESYDTLKEAVDSLKSKKEAKDVAPWTIKLTQNVTDNGATVSGISKGVVIDFQTFTYTLASSSLGLVIDNGTNEVEILGGIIQVPEASSLSQTAVITSKSDLKLSGTTLTVAASVNAIESTSGKVSIGSKTTITTKDEKDAIVVSSEAIVKVTASEVTITGGLKLSDNSEVDLGQAIYVPTKPIEKGTESTLKAAEENIQPKEGSGVEESDIEEALHNHVFSEEWTYDENYHWHEANCGHNIKINYEEHSWGNWVVTEATHTTNGIRVRSCSVCGKEQEELIPATADAHSFSEEWSVDETHHWHNATCGHSDIKSEYAEHNFAVITETFTNRAVSEVTYDKCSICDYVNPDSFSIKLVAPEYDLYEGTYAEGNVVRLSTPYDELSIYYTTDGTEPTTSSTLYVNPIVLDRNMTIKALTYALDEELACYSDVVSKNYYVKVASPQFSLKDKSTINNDSALTLTTSTDGAQIIYTTDGSTPSATNGITYSNTISFTTSCVVKAVAVRNNMEPSDVVSATYYHINDSSAESIFDITNGSISVKNDLKSVLPSVLVVPEWINGIRATAIADYGFENCNNIQILVLPDSITRIGAFAFKGCSSITSMDVGQYITEIAASAFSGWTSSQTINDYSGVIKAGALAGCNARINAIVKVGTQIVTGYGGMTNLYSISLPDSVRAIDHQTFSLCTNLNSVTMSGNITAIGSLAFNDCTSIPEITLPSILSEMSLNAFRHWTNNQVINDLSGYLYTNSLTESNAKIYTVVPSDNNTISTGDIRYRSDIYGLEIPDSVLRIDSYAFQGTGIEEITIPPNVLFLGLELFKGWDDSQTIDFVYYNNSVQVDGDRTSFSGNSAVFNVSFVEGITTIGNDAFNGMAGLESITIPSTVTSVGNSVFKNTSISSITIPDNVMSLGNYCFSNCNNLISIELPDSVTSIGDYCFANCNNLSSIELSNNLTIVGYHCFSNSNNLTTIELPDSVTSIGDYCFADNSKLTTVDLGSGVTFIPSHAFDNCPLLTTVIAPNCRGSFFVTVKVPVQQLVVNQIDITINPTYATSLSGYSTTIYRSSQQIEGDWRVFTYEVPDMLAIDYTVTITLRNANGEVVGSYNSYSEAVTSGNQSSLTKEFYLSAFNSEPKVSNPVSNPVGGTYLDGQLLTLTCSDSDYIVYTTDGTTPTDFNGTVYSSPIILDRAMTIKAVGLKEGSILSDVVTNTYNVKVNAPVFSVEAGHTYQSYLNVELSSDTSGASFYYTLDGTLPDDQSLVYTGSIEISQSSTLKAIAFKEGLEESDVTIGDYTIILPDSDIVTPTVYELVVKDSQNHSIGSELNGAIVLGVSLSPAVNTNLWTCTWSLDGVIASSTKTLSIANGEITDGYHILQLNAIYDDKPYSKQIVFRYQQEAN